jgi:hypothetical protein
MIYFVRCTLTGHVKIGYAGDPWARLSKMQSDSPGDLRLVGVEPGGADREAQLHKLFGDCRIRGEWFLPDHHLDSYLSDLPTPIKTSARRQLGGPLGKWLHEQRMTATEFSKRLGCPKATISDVCTGKHLPTWKMMRRIAEATNGAILPNDFMPEDFPLANFPPGNRSLGPRGCPAQGASVFAPVGGRAASLARVP